MLRNRNVSVCLICCVVPYSTRDRKTCEILNNLNGHPGHRLFFCQLIYWQHCQDRYTQIHMWKFRLKQCLLAEKTAKTTTVFSLERKSHSSLARWRRYQPHLWPQHSRMDTALRNPRDDSCVNPFSDSNVFVGFNSMGHFHGAFYCYHLYNKKAFG